jgi:hypothetical protein
MQLLAVAAPKGALVAAPPTALCANTPVERWDGYWGEDDRYYVRRTRAGSAQVEWFCLGDTPDGGAGYEATPAARVGAGTRRGELTEVARRARVLFGRRGPGGVGRRVMLFRVR